MTFFEPFFYHTISLSQLHIYATFIPIKNILYIVKQAVFLQFFFFFFFFNTLKWLLTTFLFAIRLCLLSKLSDVLNDKSGCRFLKPLHHFSVGPPSLNCFSIHSLLILSRQRLLFALYWVGMHEMPCKKCNFWWTFFPGSQFGGVSNLIRIPSFVFPVSKGFSWDISPLLLD